MSENKALIQQLAHFEKHEFDEIVKSYLKEVYKLPCVVVTDGKNDGGIDMKVLNDSRVKLQYQVTIQKSSNSIEKNNLNNKIIEDVVKSKRNVEHFGYAPRLEFYYSYQLTEQFIEELQNSSFSDYGITFSINEETISKEMLAMLSGDIEEKTSSLLDSLTMILNPSDKTGRKYIDEFTKMKDDKIYMTSRKSDAPQEELKDDSLDSLINNLTSHYKKKEDGLKKLRSLFGRSELVDSVIELISKNLQNYIAHARFLDDMFSNFDSLIEETVNSDN